jgi:putative drug exporter of the RND superfamily
MGLTGRLARAAAAHPKRVLAAWGAAVLVALALVATSLNGLTTDANVQGNPESTRAENAIAAAFPPTPAQLRQLTSDVIIVHSERYTTDAPAYTAFVRKLVAEGEATGKLLSVRDYVTTPGQAPVSRDRRSTELPLLVGSDDDIKPIVALVQRADTSPDFTVAITGKRTTNNDFNHLSQSDLEHGELAFGLPAALIILLLVFGSVVAGLVPIMLAILSIVVGLGLVAILSQFFGLSVFIVNMLTGMGLALGIDYSLFVISRYREERVNGASKEHAIALTGATASRAVLFSGSAFVVAMFGLLIVPTSIMRSLALGAILVGIVSVVAALTLMPALLGLLGDRIDNLRIPIVGRNLGRADALEGRFWRSIVDRVLQRPVIFLVAAASLMIAAAIPVFGLHIGASGVSTLPDRLISKQGYLTLQRYFPGGAPDPARVIVRGAGAPAVANRLTVLIRRDGGYGTPTSEVSGDRQAALVSVPLRGDVTSDRAVASVRRLRSDVIPAALAGSSAEALVGGTTAENADYFDAVTNPAPWVFAFVLGLTLVLLTIAFRSVVVALVSIVLNILSVGAAYGLLVLVFLDGVGTGLLGFDKVEAIDAWVPLFLFAVLFGLSMDYQVFLMSRVKERYDESGNTRDAVAWGVASTARIITGAALIIVVVFIGFARGELVMFQQMGFGVAVALLLDATVIRSVLLPSMMALLDGRTWYLPSWLEWLPRIEVERPAEPARAPGTASA